jgi:hypothetical protein
MQRQDEKDVMPHPPQLRRQRSGEIRQTAYFDQRRRLGGKKKYSQGVIHSVSQGSSPGKNIPRIIVAIGKAASKDCRISRLEKAVHGFHR